MGKTYACIPDSLIEWIRQQEMFFVATAPLADTGHVNLSPKGLRGSFHIEGPNKVWYDDFTGSGCETIAHLRENGRITLLFVAFEGGPRIARLYGHGVVHEFGTPEYERLVPVSRRLAASRSAIVVDIHRVNTSCGWSVPFYKFQGHRRLYTNFSRVIETDSLATQSDGIHSTEGTKMKGYWVQQNGFSIDNLPALTACHDSKEMLKSIKLDDCMMGFRPSPGPKTERQDRELGNSGLMILVGFTAGILLMYLWERMRGAIIASLSSPLDWMSW